MDDRPLTEGSVVVDASVILKLYLEEDGSRFAQGLVESGRPLAAPDLLIDEVVAVLCRNVPRHITGEGALRALAHLPTVVTTLVPHHLLRKQAADLSVSLSHAYYDCLYLALALRLDAPLITADDKFLGKIAGSAYRERAYRLDRLP